MKRTVCITRERYCECCLLYRSCSYPYVFETPVPPGAALLGKYTAAPHPSSADIPFVRLGEALAEDLRTGQAGYTETAERAQRDLGLPEVILDVLTRRGALRNCRVST